MARPAVIFIGPSRPSAFAVDDTIEVRPPAARGDLVAAAREGSPVIGLIDGVFHQSLAVTPREVRAAAALGARLFGGASMGALRAVDCPDAMTGLGAIHAAFARGELSDDDEVAVTFDPRDHQLVAYPLVQLRAVIGQIARNQPTAAPALAAYLEEVRAIPFFERTRPRLRDLARPLEIQGVAWPDVERWLDDDQTDLKRHDAAVVIAAVRAAWLDRELAAGAPGPPRLP